MFPAQPNPFNEKTLIRFYLPEATEATLSIFDETGRALFVWKAGFAKGLHDLPVLRRMLDGSPAAGLLFYKVETASDSAVRSMMIAD